MADHAGAWQGICALQAKGRLCAVADTASAPPDNLQVCRHVCQVGAMTEGAHVQSFAAQMPLF